MRTIVCVIGLVLTSGCFTDSGGTGVSVSTSEATSTGTPTSIGTSTSTPTSTDTSTSTGMSTSSGTSGSSSSGEPTGTTTMGGEGQACDSWAQDCDAGLKCVPYTDNDDGVWDANKCTPVGQGAPGGPCIAMDSPTSGYDTCKAGAICWEVDQGTLAGVCYSICAGSPNSPVCPAGSGCFMSNQGVVNVCLIACDPLLSKCKDGQVCVPDSSDQFLCLAAAGPMPVPVGGPCGYLNECEKGSMCFAASAATMLCDQNDDFCCLPYCDLSAPDCGAELECRAYPFVGKPPSELADLGLCQDPL